MMSHQFDWSFVFCGILWILSETDSTAKDEATSALDNNSEKMIQQTIDSISRLVAMVVAIIWIDLTRRSYMLIPQN